MAGTYRSAGFRTQSVDGRDGIISPSSHPIRPEKETAASGLSGSKYAQFYGLRFSSQQPFKNERGPGTIRVRRAFTGLTAGHSV